MTIREAENILGASVSEDRKSIKKKYRSLMSQYHPDILTGDREENHKKAQVINEAYALLIANCEKCEKQEKNDLNVWKSSVVESAFVERCIYMSNAIWDEVQTGYIKVVKGKYDWDPKLEEYSCFLYSINQAAIQLLEREENLLGIDDWSDEEKKTMRFPYQIKLFHLLTSQYIHPINCLKKIAKPVSIDEEQREIYEFDTRLEGVSNYKTAKLSVDSFVYVSSLTKNRIQVQTGEKYPLGYLSFVDDRLYYLVIPILKKGHAQVKCQVKSVKKKRIDIKLSIRITKKDLSVQYASNNLEIADVLTAYERFLRIQ